MEFQGRINQVLPIVSGITKEGKEWHRQDFVFEYFEKSDDKWSEKILLSVMNDKIREYDLHEGEEVIIGFSHTVRSYDGRIYNDTRIYKFNKVSNKLPDQNTNDSHLSF